VEGCLNVQGKDLWKLGEEGGGRGEGRREEGHSHVEGCLNVQGTDLWKLGRGEGRRELGEGERGEGRREEGHRHAEGWLPVQGKDPRNRDEGQKGKETNELQGQKAKRGGGDGVRSYLIPIQIFFFRDYRVINRGKGKRRGRRDIGVTSYQRASEFFFTAIPALLNNPRILSSRKDGGTTRDGEGGRRDQGEGGYLIPSGLGIFFQGLSPRDPRVVNEHVQFIFRLGNFFRQFFATLDSGHVGCDRDAGARTKFVEFLGGFFYDLKSLQSPSSFPPRSFSFFPFLSSLLSVPLLSSLLPPAVISFFPFLFIFPLSPQVKLHLPFLCVRWHIFCW
jgi:hypothetical protein